MRHRTPTLAALLTLTLAAPMADAIQAEDFQINTYTTGSQRRPAVAVGVDGSFVVVWDSDASSGPDTSRSIQGRRYASDGTALGEEFQVNTWTTGFQEFPKVLLDTDGDFVVLWESEGSLGNDTSGGSIQGRFFASDGTAIGEEFQINTYTSGDQARVAGAMEADGDFVVVWFGDGSSGTDTADSSIQGRRFTSAGSAIGDEFQVNTYTTGGQAVPAVALDAQGNFVAVWQSETTGAADPDGSIQAQRFISDGSAIGGEFQVNTITSSDQAYPTVALDSVGNFLVTWFEWDFTDSDIQGQRFASSGTALGGEFRVNTYTPDVQRYPVVAADPGGGFLVVWYSEGSPSSDRLLGSIQGRRYASDGRATHEQFQVNTYTTNHQSDPALSIGPDGSFVAVWYGSGSGGTDSSSFSIQGKRFPLLFADGFESGDASAWSESFP